MTTAITTDNNQTADLDRRLTYARTLSALLAEYIQEIFPQADAAVFETSPDGDSATGTDVRLLAIYQGPVMLWLPATIVIPDAGKMPELSLRTVDRIEIALEWINDANPDVFKSFRGSLEHPCERLDLVAALEWYPAAETLTGSPYHGHAVLNALANASNIGRVGLTEDELCADVGPVLTFADIPALTANGYVTLGGQADGYRYRITPAGVQELARVQAAASTEPR